MNIPGLPEGLILTGYHASLKKPDFVFSHGIVQKFEQCTGSFFTVKPADGYEFAYDPLTDSYDVVRVLEQPVSYTVEFRATTAGQLKEIQSILDGLAKHTTVFSNFSRTENA